MDKIKKSVYEVLENISGKKEFEDSDSLSEHLMLDSLNRILLLVMLEEELGIEFDESHLNPYDLITVGDVVRLAGLYGEKTDE